MATDLTGAPTALGIGTYNTSVDAPSGLGFNAAMAQIDALIAARVAKPAGIIAGEVSVWNGTTWVRPTATPISLSSIAAAPSAKVRGNGTFSLPNNTITALTGMNAVTDWSQGGMVVNTNGIVVPTAGIYHVRAFAAFAANAAGYRDLYATVAGGTRLYSGASLASSWNGNIPMLAAHGLVTCAASDQIAVQASQNSGGALNIDIGSVLYMGLEVTKVG